MKCKICGRNISCKSIFTDFLYFGEVLNNCKLNYNYANIISNNNLYEENKYSDKYREILDADANRQKTPEILDINNCVCNKKEKNLKIVPDSYTDSKTCFIRKRARIK